MFLQNIGKNSGCRGKPRGRNARACGACLISDGRPVPHGLGKGVIAMTTFVEPVSHIKARAIMGKNFLGLDEVRRGYSVALNPEQLAEIPFKEETLQACKDTHVLVAGAPLSLNEVRKIAASDFYNIEWCSQEPFATTRKVTVRWYLLRKGPVPESRNKTYDQQIALLMKGEEVPLACEVTYTVILYWLTHRERLLPDVYVRCQDRDSGGDDGDGIVVGRFDSDGFQVCHDLDGIRDDVIGLGSFVSLRKS